MISIDNLTKTFGKTIAVNSLTMHIKQGSVFGFLGPNGAGKTTTLRMLLGLIRPDSGSISINGLNPQENPVAVKAVTGYLPDEIFLYDYLSGRDFLNFVADIYGIKGNDKKQKIDWLLDYFGLTEAADEFSANYSLGMRKKLALAAVIIHDPSLLILDEPFNGLDPQASVDMRNLLKLMSEKGTTIIFSSHVLEVVEKTVTNVGIIKEGHLAISSSMPDIKSQYGSLEKAFFSVLESK